MPSSWRQSSQEFRIEKYGFDPFHMFEYPAIWDEAESGVLHRVVTLEKDQIRQRLALQFNGIFQKAYIYWNGEMLAETQEAYLPTYVDITGKGREGENQLHVVCTSFNSCFIASGQEEGDRLGWFLVPQAIPRHLAGCQSAHHAENLHCRCGNRHIGARRTLSVK
ncbi:MAG: sugar-binding domain-containing protein [Clostridia bacterium]